MRCRMGVAMNRGTVERRRPLGVIVAILAGSVLTACLAVAPWAGRAAGSTHPPRGALSLLTGPGACLGPGCARLRGPSGSARIAISSDGRNVYLAGHLGGLAVLSRDRRTGRLRQLSGRAGCIRSDRRAGCAFDPELRGPGMWHASGYALGWGELDGPGMIVSPDGRSLYVTTLHGILAFARAPATGAVRRLAGAQGCLDISRRACGRLRGLTSPTLLLPAGNRMYAFGTQPNGRFEGGALVALARDPATGRLTELSGKQGCANAGGSDGCHAAPCLYTEAALAMSHDGSQLYVGSGGSFDPESAGVGSVSTFGISRTGALSLIGCAQRAEAISDLVAGPTGNAVLASTFIADRGSGLSSATVDLYQPAPNAQLLPTRSLVCAYVPPRRCQIPFGPSAARLAITPDGKTVYYSMGAIATLRAGPDSLTPLPGHWGCLFPARVNFYTPPRHCARAGQRIGYEEAISPDGRSLYVDTVGFTSGLPYHGGIETFSIQH